MKRFLFILIVVIALFPRPLFERFLIYKMGKMTHQLLQAHLTMAKISFDQGIMIDEARLERVPNLRMDLREIHLAPHLLGKGGKFEIGHVSVSMQKSQSIDIKELKKFLFDPAWRGEVKSGELLLYDFCDGGPVFQRVLWHFTATQEQGIFTFHFPDHAPCICVIDKQKGTIDLALSTQPLPLVSALVSFFGPQKIGVIQGEISLSCQYAASQIRGTLLVTDATVHVHAHSYPIPKAQGEFAIDCAQGQFQGALSMTDQRGVQSELSYQGEQDSLQFQGKHFSLETLLTPFFSKVKIMGYAAITGKVEEQTLSCDYSVEQLCIENNVFCVRASCATGKHTFDLKKGSHSGFSDIAQGIYRQQNNSFLLEECQGRLWLSHKGMKAKGLTACFEDMRFTGGFELAGEDLCIKTQCVEGSVAAISHLIACFTKKYPTLPLQGEIVSGSKEMTLCFHAGKLVQGEVAGTLKASLQMPFMQMEGCSLHFHYDILKAQLLLQGRAGRYCFPSMQTSPIDVEIASLDLSDHLVEGAFSLEKDDRTSDFQMHVQDRGGAAHLTLRGDETWLRVSYAEGTFEIERFQIGPWRGSAHITAEGDRWHAQVYLDDGTYPVLGKNVVLCSSCLDLFFAHEQGKISLKRIEGGTEGLDLFLENEEGKNYKGYVRLHMPQAQWLFPEVLREYVSRWPGSDSYLFEGIFALAFPHITSFVGSVRSAHLTASLHYTPSNLIVENASFDDKASHGFLKEAHLFKEGDKWHFDIPRIILEKVSLSSLTKGQESVRKAFFKPLVINAFCVNDLRGVLGEKNSVEGEGRMSFSALARSFLETQLFLLPSAIAGRIGIDPTLLIPSQGTVAFTVQEGKIYFTDFKDVSSEGGMSTFHLVQECPAYLSLDGQLSLKIKMKQYNLLMKLAEFFVITIEGDLLKPEYTFTRRDSEEL